MQNSTNLVQGAQESVQMIRPVPALILQLDLRREITLLMQQSRKPMEYCNRVRDEYLRFLALSKWYRTEELMPSDTIDELWHIHIDSGEKYERDCVTALDGKLIHVPAQHPPRSEDGDRDPIRLRIWMLTETRYTENFGPWPRDLWSRPPPCSKKGG